MKKLLFVFPLILAGCGPSKEDKTISQVNSVAERIAEVGEDGWFKKKTVEDVDVWGNVLHVKYERSKGHESLFVVSNGPDGLLHTKDDIVSKSLSIENEEALKAISEARKKAISDHTESITYGATRGVIKGLFQKEK
jgi:hypothetical protein